MAGFRSKGGVERRATRPAARTALRRFAMPLFQHFVAASSRHPPIAGTMPRQSAMPGSPRSDFRGVAQLNHPQFPTVSGAFFAVRFFNERLPTHFTGICPPKSGHNRKSFQCRREPVFAARIIPLGSRYCVERFAQ
ncbi:hypothetical protein [Burkholderia pseudomallei]|uniref:hypothetical protein n=1 Tax=Burkholderia pseudomallei TaxID=28450 RepID=UPI0000F28B1A|nr:hypothetical protein [Burkholderia pseudomallei]ABN85724.1 hypothetical protein BURPS668_A1117 [Burkholderia pseudomallei 668]KGS29698.1 hypothetical protein X962_3071 [Burkholderia pseudomallei MSHR7343]MBF3427442.1 hypothetical protein [Burkholderia pseudomallei]MBF3439462.1 hypothetical protein [Burkholderia pseudomallei]MBF3463505.1 hypothetical protein [Burkholderia pseudomallei]